MARSFADRAAKEPVDNVTSKSVRCALPERPAPTARPTLDHPDLSAAIDGGVGRVVTEPSAPEMAVEWTAIGGGAADSLIPMPRSLCWSGDDLLVADAAESRIQRFDPRGRHLGGFGGAGEGPGEFRSIEQVRCSPDGRTVLATDMRLWRVTLFGADGEPRRFLEAPRTPQGVPYLGEFAVADDGTWYDAWISARVGPYLDGAAWDEVRLVRAWNPDGSPRGEFGEPVAYEDPVLRREFNRLWMAPHRDTLWVLSEGDAAIRGFDGRGRPVGEPIVLPVHHRGSEPLVEVGEDAFPSGLRRNRAVYQPNVGGMAVVHDSLFAVVRLRDYEIVESEEGTSRRHRSRAYLDVADRRGRVLATVPVPGAVEVVAAHRGRVAVIAEEAQTGVRRVLAADLPRPPG